MSEKSRGHISHLSRPSRVELRLLVGAGPDDRGIGTDLGWATPLETRDQLRAGRMSNFDGVVA